MNSILQRCAKTFSINAVKHSRLIPALLLLASVVMMYAMFLRNPPVFDDASFFDSATLQAYSRSAFHFDLRWFAYASMGWTQSLFGGKLIAFRLVNLLLHAASAIALFLFLRRLFGAVLLDTSDKGLSHTWLAFFGALLFAVHPVSVYATEYLIQRSTLMATLFSVLSWHAYLEGLLKGRWRWFVVSATMYFLAVFSKEHAVMAPAVALAMTLLLYPPSPNLLRKIALPFALFALIGLLITLKTKGVLGAPYEPYAQDMLKRMSESHAIFKPDSGVNLYPLSVATQCLLYFKYLLMWLLPNPAWMSVDMREPFASSLSEWPYALATAGFVLYGAGATWMLLRRGKQGLLGFVLLLPWLMFATELATVRIQEPFVLYRSYLWMGPALAAIPMLVLGNIPVRRALSYLLGASLMLLPLTWDRLTTFSHPLLLWDDAASLIEDKPYLPGFERIYHNRGAALYEVGLKQQAFEDYSRVIAMNPDYGYVYNNRGSIYFDWGQYDEALRDFNKATEFEPAYPRPYLGRGLLFEKLGKLDGAYTNYKFSCTLGLREGCEMLQRMDNKASNILSPQQVP